MTGVNHRRSLLAISVALSAALTIGLAACTLEDPDLQAAQRGASTFITAASQDDGVLGSTSALIGPRLDDRVDGSGITLTFDQSATLDSIDVACFGGGDASVGVTVSSPSRGTNGVVVPIPCDGETREAPLPETRTDVTEVTINGGLDRGSAAVLATVLRGSTP